MYIRSIRSAVVLDSMGEEHVHRLQDRPAVLIAALRLEGATFQVLGSLVFYCIGYERL